VENICGTPKADFLKVCEVLASTSAADRTTTFLYALGWTQHTVGAQNIRTMAMIQLLLGNMGMAGGGVNALRGHSNIQGLTDWVAVDQSAGLSDAAVRKTGRSATLISRQIHRKPCCPIR
jgi:anaerobic selenocysteine-containing dehydrogenase